MSAIANRDLTKNSETGGVVTVTIAATPADISPASRPVLSCLVAQKSGTQVYMNIGSAVTPATMATSTDWKLSTTPIAVPVTDLSQLHFLGTANDIVQILWRS